MSDWTNWENIEIAKVKKGVFNDFGIYQIHAISPDEKVIPINRLVGSDPLGIIYIGRSGINSESPNRTIANRINEFVKAQHSGGVTYLRALPILKRSSIFHGHRLQARAMFLPDNEIKVAETKIMSNYFELYGELPPCNSSFPQASSFD